MTDPSTVESSPPPPPAPAPAATSLGGDNNAVPAASVAANSVPDGGWGWFVVAASFVTQALTVGTTYTFGVLYSDLLKVFAQSESTTAWIGSIQSSLLYMTGVVAGPLIHSFGCRVVALCGAFLSCFGFAVSAAAPNVFVLYLTYGVITGIGNGLMYVTASIVIHLYFDKRRSMATGIAVTGSGIGTLSFGFLTNLLLTRLQWHWTLVIEGGMMLLDFQTHALILDGMHLEAYRARFTLEAAAGPHSNHRVGWREFVTSLFDFSLFRCPPFVLFCITAACFGFGYHVPYTYTPERAQRMYNVDAQRAALLVSLMGVANVASRPLIGLVADRSATLRFYALVSVAIGCGLSSVMVFLMNTYSLMVLYSILFGAFGGCWASLFFVVVVDMMGVDVVEKSIGLSLTVSSVGFLIAAPISGLIITATNSNFNVPFAFVGAVQVIGGFILLFSRCFRWPTAVSPVTAAGPSTDSASSQNVSHPA